MEQNNFQTCMKTVKKVKSGWLLPDGTFDECLYGEHSALSFEYVQDNEWKDELREYRLKYFGEHARDFLIREKKYILLDCPCCNDKVQYMTYKEHTRYSKKQIQTLLDLFKDETAMYDYIVRKC